MRAFFTAIEGGDTCGKGTQVKLLADRLGAKTFKFPDKNTLIGALIYDHLFQRWAAIAAIEPNAADAPSKQSELLGAGLTDAMMFQCMQMANRLEHAKEITETLYTSEQSVVVDRYTASGIVYGGHDGLDPHYISKIQEWLPKPNLNILLDIDAGDAAERMKLRGDTPDRYERADIISRIIVLYRRYWEKMQREDSFDFCWVVIDGRRPEIEVAADVMLAVKRYWATR